MGFVANLFNPSQGAGFQGAQANVLNPTTTNQAQTAYGGTQNALQQQQAFLNALQAQNGIGNQSNVYNQLQGVAQGTGPNPAQAMLNQATGQNVSNQAALMGSQRGASQNVGLMARQAGQQGANLQQQAIGQGASMQAQQSLGALGQMGSLATQQVGQQQGALGTLNQAQQSEQNQLLNSINAQNQANVGMQGNINQVNAGIAQGNQAAQAGMWGSLTGGTSQLTAAGGSGGGAATKAAHGGMIEHFQDGGQAGYSNPAGTPNAAGGAGNAYSTPAPTTSTDPQSFAGKFLQGYSGAENKQLQQLNAQPQETGLKGMQQSGQKAGAGMGSLVSTGLGALMAKGGNVKDLKGGGHVPGKAKVAGDDLKNDTVDAKLSPWEIVLPRSVTMSDDPVKKSAKFVAAILAKNGGMHASR